LIKQKHNLAPGFEGHQITEDFKSLLFQLCSQDRGWEEGILETRLTIGVRERVLLGLDGVCLWRDKRRSGM